MNSEEMLRILEHIEREKGIEKEILFTAIESALASAARKIVGKKVEDITVRVDRKTGEIKVISEGKDIKSEEFGRIAAQTAKQVIIQKIREAEREVIYGDFHERIHTILTGAAHRIDRNSIIVDLGKTEAILPRKEMCYKDNFKQGDRVRALILEVRKTTKGPQIVLSRTHPMFVKRLFEMEVPEIDEDIVEIKGVAREAGNRTKMAVYSKEEKVDPVGACVGMRGQRVKNIVRELGGERIDIIRWNEEIREFIKGALSPAQISNIEIDKDNQRAKVIVADDQLSLAIGKQGQNVRLASKLTGWNIDIRSKKEVNALEKTIERLSILSIDGIGRKARDVLEKAGYDTIDKIADTTVEKLMALPGIGEKSAKKMIESAKELIKHLQKENIEEAEEETGAVEEERPKKQAVEDIAEEKDEVEAEDAEEETEEKEKVEQEEAEAAEEEREEAAEDSKDNSPAEEEDARPEKENESEDDKEAQTG